MKPTLLALSGAALLLCGCAPRDSDDAAARVVAGDAVCRPPIAGRDVTSCFMTLTASHDDRLVSVMTPLAREAQVHEMSTEGGVMRMRHLPGGLPLPAGEAVSLSPGGTHLMLIEVRASLQAGEEGAVPLALSFENAAPITVEARIGQPASETARGSH